MEGANFDRHCLIFREKAKPTTTATEEARSLYIERERFSALSKEKKTLDFEERIFA